MCQYPVTATLNFPSFLPSFLPFHCHLHYLLNHIALFFELYSLFFTRPYRVSGVSYGLYTFLILSSFLPFPGVAASSLFTSGKYAIDPELRGAEFERITQNLDVHFWKTFWNITETEVPSVSSLCFFVTRTRTRTLTRS